MTSKEAALQRLKELKGKPLKVKLEHILTYYWFPIVAIAGLLIFTVSYSVHVITLKETVLNVTCVNSIVEDDVGAQYARSFAGYLGIDTEKYRVEISADMMTIDEGNMSSYDSAEVLITLVAAQTIDVLVSDEESMFQRFYQDILADLSKMLTPQQQAMYQDSFLYLDNAVLQEVKNLKDLTNIPSFPDPAKPEQMQQPVPVAIRIPADAEFARLFFPDRVGEVVIGFAVNTKNLSNALNFLDYVME